MEKVLGIGGFFFAATDKTALAAWYHANLGIPFPPDSYATLPWIQQGGPTVFATDSHGSQEFGTTGKTWSINFRVRDLDKMVSQLRAAGIMVEVDPETYPNGRFAKLTDPEGNPIELWEPMGQEASYIEQTDRG